MAVGFSEKGEKGIVPGSGVGVPEFGLQQWGIRGSPRGSDGQGEKETVPGPGDPVGEAWVTQAFTDKGKRELCQGIGIGVPVFGPQQWGGGHGQGRETPTEKGGGEELFLGQGMGEDPGRGGPGVDGCGFLGKRGKRELFQGPGRGGPGVGGCGFLGKKGGRGTMAVSVTDGIVPGPGIGVPEFGLQQWGGKAGKHRRKKGGGGDWSWAREWAGIRGLGLPRRKGEKKLFLGPGIGGPGGDGCGFVGKRGKRELFQVRGLEVFFGFYLAFTGVAFTLAFRGTGEKGIVPGPGNPVGEESRTLAVTEQGERGIVPGSGIGVQNFGPAVGHTGKSSRHRWARGKRNSSRAREPGGRGIDDLSFHGQGEKGIVSAGLTDHTSAGRYPNYYSYCNSLSGCKEYYIIGRCHCLDISGTPQYAADTTNTPGDGWISGPVAASGAAQPSGGAVAFSEPTFKNLQGRTLQSFDFGNTGTVDTRSENLSPRFVTAGRYPNYYSYCNSLSGCKEYYIIGRCHCLDISGTPQYAADTTSTPGDGWISGPVAASGAAQPSGGAVAFSEPTFKNLQGRTLQSFDFGNTGTVADCQAKCAANSECKGFNFCPAGGPGTCPSGVVGQCDIKTWDSGPATFYAEATNVGGDGWQSSYRTNLSS
eukprot:jgi/Botrbrau1/19213/Bobra.0077s0114.1